MKKENWVWMPHAGHCVIGHMCRFHLATYVGKYIVSTIGEYWPDRGSREIHAKIWNEKWYEKNKHLKGDYFDAAYFKKFGYETLGAGDKSIYETMVFKARKSKEKCCRYVMVSGEDLDGQRYATSGEATKGHMKFCNKWSKT